MTKLLLAIFLIVIGYKIMADIPAIYKFAASKHALPVENPEDSEQEKEKGKTSESDLEYIFNFQSQIQLLKIQSLALRTASFEDFKLSSGFTNQAYTPPNLPSL